MIYIGHNNNTPFFLEIEGELNTTDNVVVYTWDDFIDNNVAWLKLSAQQELFYNAHSDATPEEVYKMEITPEPTPDPEPAPVPTPNTLEEARQAKLSEIREQDTFSNKFFVSITQGGVEVTNQELWIDKDLRNSLYSITLPALQSDGEITTKLWTISTPPQSIDVPITWAMEKLPLLEIYAKRTYDRRASNEAAVYAATTVEEISLIDVKADYPLFLTFELNLDLHGSNNQ